LALAYLRVNMQMTNADYQVNEKDKRLNQQFYGMYVGLPIRPICNQ